MKFGIGLNLIADITKDQTTVGAEATITHEGVVDAAQAGITSAKEGMTALVAKTRSVIEDKKVVEATDKAKEAGVAIITRAREFAVDGLDKTADLISKETTAPTEVEAPAHMPEAIPAS